MPAFTEFIFGLSSAVKDHFPVTVAVLAGLATLLAWFAHTRFGRPWSMMATRTPKPVMPC